MKAETDRRETFQLAIMEKLSAQGIHSEEMVTFRINNQDIIAAAITKDVLNVVRAAAVQAAMQVSHESTTLLPELKEGMQKIQEPGSNLSDCLM